MPDGLIHVPDQSLVAVGNHKHAVRDFAVAHAGEEDDGVQVMADGAVDGYGHGVDGVFGRQDPDKQTLARPQLCAYVSCPENKNIKQLLGKL